MCLRLTHDESLVRVASFTAISLLPSSSRKQEDRYCFRIGMAIRQTIRVTEPISQLFLGCLSNFWFKLLENSFKYIVRSQSGELG